MKKIILISILLLTGCGSNTRMVEDRGEQHNDNKEMIKTMATDTDTDRDRDTAEVIALTDSRYDSGGNIITEYYDKNGNTLTQYDSTGNLIHDYYDANGNIIDKYDANGNLSNNYYDKNGNLMTSHDMENTNSQHGMNLRTLYFDFDASELKEDYIEALEEHVNFLLANPEVSITLEGHADERGSREYNMALGERRAKVVKEVLRFRGISPRQLEVISYGEEKPIMFGHDEPSMEKNRRVEIIYPEGY